MKGKRAQVRNGEVSCLNSTFFHYEISIKKLVSDKTMLNIQFFLWKKGDLKIRSVLVVLWYIEKSILWLTLEINMSRKGKECEDSNSI